MKRSPVATRVDPPEGAAALRLSGSSERLRAAARDHEDLVKRLARKRELLERLQAEAHGAAREVVTRLAPIVDEARRIDGAIHALFRELLAADRPRRARSRIRQVYVVLQSRGVLSMRFDDLDPGGETDEGGGPDPDPLRGARPGPQASAPAAAPTAARHDDRGALRDLYRRLVELLHPDRVQDEADKARRTEAMKVVTVAFRERDLGRLLEIERAWAAGPAAPASDDEAERRLAVLDEQNRHLRKQLRAVEKELRAFRRSREGHIARAVDAQGRERVVAEAEGEAAGEVAALSHLRDFVAAFRDGRMSLEDFLAGPDLGPDDDGDEDLEAQVANLSEEELLALIGQLGQDLAGARRGRRPPRGAAGGKGRRPPR